MTVEIQKGLSGVYLDETRISKVFEDTDSLTYRGYAVQDLAAQKTFEDVAYLLWHGELPTMAARDAFIAHERAQREIDAGMIAVIKNFRKDAHPMDTLRTLISFMGANDASWEDQTPKGNLEKAIKMYAKIPTMIAADYRIRKGLDPISPRADLSFAANFFHMYFGEVPSPEIVKCFDASLTFYAEHGFNASTFTARVITSSLSDIYSAVTGAVGSLKGPLHGGANEAVMHMMLEIGTADRAEAWIKEAIASKKLIMGFGHRVYKNGDSRVPYMTKVYHEMARIKNDQNWMPMSKILADVMLKEKNIHPNLDFPVGPAYYMMGFDIPTFTPIFVMSRITGWTAHIIEQLEKNKLMRPLSVYTGVAQRPL